MGERKTEYQMRLKESQLTRLREIAFLNNCIYKRSNAGCVPHLVEKIVSNKVTILIKGAVDRPKSEEKTKRYNLRITNTGFNQLKEIAKDYGYIYRKEGSIGKFLRAIANKEVVIIDKIGG